MPLTICPNCNAMKKKLVIIGVLTFMLFGLFGCGRPKTPEEATKIYLEKKYHKSFEVLKMTREGDGPFLPRNYSGYAQEVGHADQQFKVWVDKDLRKCYDSYFCIQILPDVNQWLQEKAEAQWENVKVFALIDVLNYEMDESYLKDDFIAFMKDYQVSTRIYLLLPEGALTVDSYCNFNESITGCANGIVQVIICPEEQMAGISLDKALKNGIKSVFAIGKSNTMIADDFENLGRNEEN